MHQSAMKNYSIGLPMGPSDQDIFAKEIPSFQIILAYVKLTKKY